MLCLNVEIRVVTRVRLFSGKFPRDTAIQAYPNATSVIRWESDENLRCRLGGIDVVLNVLHSLIIDATQPRRD